MSVHIKMKIRDFLFVHFERFPVHWKYVISKLMFRPVIGKGARIYGNVIFGPNVVIGDYSYIHDQSHVNNIAIGKYVRIAKKFSTIYTTKNYNHFSNFIFFSFANSPLIDMPSKNTQPEIFSNPKISIGNDVWIGENVSIFSGVTIGDGAVIGACSLVTKDVPPYSIAYGVPAKVVKYRFDKEKIEMLQKSAWWDWSPSKIYNDFEKLCSFELNIPSSNDSDL